MQRPIMYGIMLDSKIETIGVLLRTTKRMRRMIEEREFMERYIEKNRRRLTDILLESRVYWYKSGHGKKISCWKYFIIAMSRHNKREKIRLSENFFSHCKKVKDGYEYDEEVKFLLDNIPEKMIRLVVNLRWLRRVIG